MWKMSIQYPVPGFELTTYRLWVSFNHSTRAPDSFSLLRLFNTFKRISLQKMASVWIRTSDLWCRKPRLCQLWNIPEANLMQLMHNYLYFEKNQWSLKSLDLFKTVQSRPLTIYFHDDWKLNIAGKMFDWRKISQMKILYSMALKTIWRVQSISDFFRANTKTVSSG